MGMESVEVYEQRRMQVADRILANPSEFDMLAWGYKTSCGTAACLAGTAALLAEEQGRCAVVWMPMLSERASTQMNGVVMPDGEHWSVDVFALEYLGLGRDNLFYDYDMTAEQAAKRLLEAPYAVGVRDADS